MHKYTKSAKNNVRELKLSLSDSGDDGECSGVGLMEIHGIFVIQDDFFEWNSTVKHTIPGPM